VLAADTQLEAGTLFSPDTLLKWNRWFIALKYDGSDRRGKRGLKPTKANMIRKLVLRMAAENPRGGTAGLTASSRSSATTSTGRRSGGLSRVAASDIE